MLYINNGCIHLSVKQSEAYSPKRNYKRKKTKLEIEEDCDSDAGWGWLQDSQINPVFSWDWEKVIFISHLSQSCPVPFHLSEHGLHSYTQFYDQVTLTFSSVTLSLWPYMEYMSDVNFGLQIIYWYKIILDVNY